MTGFDRREVDSIYLDDDIGFRFVVSYIIGIEACGNVETPADALGAALRLTRDDSADGTSWHVFDRATGIMHRFEQGDGTGPRQPGAPTPGAATGGSGHATVSWFAPRDNGGAPITGYIVTPYVDYVAQSSRRFDSAMTGQVITGLSNDTSYTFTVAAINANGIGTESIPSHAVTPN